MRDVRLQRIADADLHLARRPGAIPSGRVGDRDRELVLVTTLPVTVWFDGSVIVAVGAVGGAPPRSASARIQHALHQLKALEP